MSNATTGDQYLAETGKASPLDSAARQAVLGMLAKIRHGQITLCDGDEVQSFGRDNNPSARITVVDRRFYRRALFGGAIGAGESYVDGLWEVDDLTALTRIMVLNMELMNRLNGGLGLLLRPINLLRHAINSNTRHGAKRNIIAHYDLGNELYASFLDSTMMYSSAIYPAADSSLEEAAEFKLKRICEKLALGSDDQVIEIGAGWGGFAIYAAANYGCRVTTTTISDAQYAEAKRRIERAGLSDRITLLKKDYRDLTGRFDKLVSIEMIEAVGNRYLPAFFGKCNELLKEDGTMLIQAITLRDYQFAHYSRTVDFIQRHVFPGGCVVSVARMLALLAEKTDLVVRQIDDFGFDYARTLADWRSRFHAAFDQLRDIGYDERFKRLWDYYLSYCEGGFRERSISVVHLVATRPANREIIGRP